MGAQLMFKGEILKPLKEVKRILEASKNVLTMLQTAKMEASILNYLGKKESIFEASKRVDIIL